MRVFKTQDFAKWAKKQSVTDKAIKKAVSEMQKGLIYAELGDGLCKQQIARPGQGKRGGHRTLIAFKKDDRAVFVFGLSKSDRANIDEQEEKLYRQLAIQFLSLTEEKINYMLAEKTLIEVSYEQD
ncbi:MAG: type II toxin-antitoxin system RelE/ParE family toxin [Gammaproteobacteria bacterium]|nr:type II toxin-antitoxin system RelE/ParE family toxin [Gammaproteobacteria bacterium]